MKNYQASIQVIKRKCKNCGNSTLRYVQRLNTSYIYCPSCDKKYKFSEIYGRKKK